MSHTLAWHESLELHELTASQANSLIKLKKAVKRVEDKELRELYLFSIKAIEGNLHELIQYYPNIPVPESRKEEETPADFIAFYAGDLLLLAKTSVRNYSIAITETASYSLRKTLKKQLNAAIDWHERIFLYMFNRGLYPAYNLQELIANDLKNVKRALEMREE